MNKNYLNKQLVDYMGLEGASIEEQERILLETGDVIAKNIFMRVIPLLSDEDQQALNMLLDKEEKAPSTHKDAIFEFLSAKIPDLDEIVKDEIANFTQFTVDTMGSLKSENPHK